VVKRQTIESHNQFNRKWPEGCARKGIDIGNVRRQIEFIRFAVASNCIQVHKAFYDSFAAVKT